MKRRVAALLTLATWCPQVACHVFTGRANSFRTRHVPKHSYLRHAVLSTTEEASTQLCQAYQVGGGMLTCAWTACAVASLATYKPWRVVHNTIGVVQALTVLPLIWASTTALASAARDGWARLRLASFRRLNLGLAAACIWSAFAVIAAPAITAANVRSIDPVIYPPLLCATTVPAYLWVAGLCVDTWRRTVSDATPMCILRGAIRSLWLLGPPTSLPAPLDGKSSRSECNCGECGFLSLAFGGFSAAAIFTPFPLATVPSLLGKRLARAS
mmetsp:Transcript_47456/g.78535  ORF Transcript_47456/g.78535 Transcript_47456/m.78535 type:complete len:271 (-) Transcript_47456:140-952(-)